MAKIRLRDPVLVDGVVTTIAELATAGQITFHCFEVTCRKRLGERRTRVCYSADLPDGTGWEIGKTAYMSRTAGKLDFGG